MFNRCATMSDISPGSTNTYDCNGMEGRYINIVIPGQTQYLAICEVKVTGESLKTPPTAGDSNFFFFLINILMHTTS